MLHSLQKTVVHPAAHPAGHSPEVMLHAAMFAQFPQLLVQFTPKVPSSHAVRSNKITYMYFLFKPRALL